MRWFVVSIVLVALILVPFVLFENQFNALAESVTRGEASGWYSATAIAVLLASDVFLPFRRASWPRPRVWCWVSCGAR